MLYGNIVPGGFVSHCPINMVVAERGHRSPDDGLPRGQCAASTGRRRTDDGIWCASMHRLVVAGNRFELSSPVDHRRSFRHIVMMPILMAAVAEVHPTANRRRG